MNNNFGYTPYSSMASMAGNYGRMPFRSLFGGIGRLNWGSFLNNTQKTLNVINQAIPVYNQVKPMYNNAKTMFGVLGAMRENGNKTQNNSRQNTPSQNNQRQQPVNKQPVNEENKPIFFV